MGRFLYLLFNHRLLHLLMAVSYHLLAALSILPLACLQLACLQWAFLPLLPLLVEILVVMVVLPPTWAVLSVEATLEAMVEEGKTLK